MRIYTRQNTQLETGFKFLPSLKFYIHKVEGERGRNRKKVRTKLTHFLLTIYNICDLKNLENIYNIKKTLL